MTYQHPQPMLLLLIASLLMLAACQGGGPAQGGGAQQNSVESTLRAIAAGDGTDFSVVYDDMHGLWGGQTIAVSGSGAYERKERARGDSAPTVTSGTVGQQQIRQLAGLLVDLAAWEQRVPERAPVPDESRATLRIRVGATEVTIWEWFNDLPKNARIAQIRDLMRSFA